MTRDASWRGNRMPSRTPEFVNAGVAAAALAEFAKNFAFPRDDRSAEAIALESANRPWIKSMLRKRPGGVEFYEGWARESLPRMVKSERYVINQEQFDILVRRTGLDLLRNWRGGLADRLPRLSYGAAFRVVDQLLLEINESERCRSGPVEGLLHVPLDGVALRPLRDCMDELIDGDFTVEIPAMVPSGFIATEEQYRLLQGAIMALADRAGVAPVAYAYYCASL